MCGIVGYVGSEQSSELLYEGLRRLEYRGYDSAGIAVMNGSGMNIVRAVGNLAHLGKALETENVTGNAGIGHTRWATHGKPSEANAHPHKDCTNRLAIVHNGIIENFAELREELTGRGHDFRSETDTEVIAHLIEEHMANGCDSLPAAVREASKYLDGTYAIAAVCTDDPDHIVAARKDSPLVIGVGESGNFLASGIPAFLAHTRKVINVENGDVVILSADSITILDENDRPITRESETVTWDVAAAEKGGYDDFMLKEIFEQPEAFRNTIRGRFKDDHVTLDELKLTDQQVADISKIYIVACGTSYHAGMVGKYAIEKWARIPVELDVASEFRYRDPVIDENTLVIAISQSGETADTLAGVVQAREQGAKVLAVVNVVGSLLTREADILILTHAGPEIGVAATKTFTCQLAAMYLVGLYLATAQGTLSSEKRRSIISDLENMPEMIQETLEDDSMITQATEKYFELPDFLYLGRGVGFPVALEGALKMKEISYIHAEGYAAGEMKHGPIALIEDGTPVITVANNSPVQDKVLSNVQESIARGASIVIVGTRGDKLTMDQADDFFPVPDCDEILSPVLTTIPLQLFSYHVAKRRGCNVDQPRNLAKSVTVE